MARAVFLTLLVLLAAAGAAHAARASTSPRAFLRLGGEPGDEPAPTSCLSFADEDSCLEQTTCSWCSNTVLGQLGCVPQPVASLVPAALANCKHADDDDDDADADADLQGKKHDDDDDKPDDPKPKPPTSCGDNKEKRDCLKMGAEEGECAWCEGDFMPASCVGVKAAEWIPAQVAKCKMPKKHKKDDGADAVELTKGKKHDDDDDKPDDPKPKPPTSCGDNKEKRDCLKMGAEEGECAWCEGDFMPASCVGVKAAEWIPAQVAKCKMPKKHKKDDGADAVELTKGKKHDDDDDKPDDPKPKPPTSCGDNKEKRDCLKMGAEEGECAWCEGDFMPASCVGVKAAEWIPAQVAKCKMPKKHKKDDGADAVELTKGKKHDDDDDKPDDPKPKPPTSCGDNKEKRDCLRMGAEEGECAWCEGDFMPASCVGVKAAEWIPAQVAKCKMPKKHKKDDGADAADAEDALLQKGHKKHHKKKHDDDSGSGGGWGPSGGSGWGPSGGSGWGPSGGSGWGPSGGSGGGQGCMALKSKKKCLRGTDTEACAWCGASSFLGSPCVSEGTAKFLPKMVADCKMGKGPKKHAGSAEQVAAS